MGKPFENKQDSVLLLAWGGFILLLCVIALLVYGAISNLENLTKFTFYFIILIFVIVMYVAISYYRGKRVNKNLYVIINEPEKSPVLPKFLRQTPTLLFFFLAILLGLISVGIQQPQSVIGNLGQTSLPNYLQSAIIQPVGKIIFDVEPASSTETIAFALLSCIFMYFLLRIFNENLISIRSNIGKFVLAGFIFSLFWGFGWMLFHTARYSDSDIVMFAVFKFGFISGVLMWITQSILFPILYHIYNNLFLSLLGTVGTKDIYSVIIAVLAVGFLTLGIVSLLNKSFNERIKELFPI